MEDVIIFGAAKAGMYLKRKLEKSKQFHVCYFCDNNESKYGMIFDGVQVLAWNEVLDLYKLGFKGSIVIATLKIEEIIEQIRKCERDLQIYGVTKAYLTKEINEENEICKVLYPIDYKFKPRLKYFEYDVAEHCNLNCRNCGHLSNVAKTKFGNFEHYVKDINRIKEIFWGVEKIRLMGGEPLLNPQLINFISVTRNVFPDADIRIVTNGLLIPNANQKLFQTMKEYNVEFDISQYPPTKEIIEKIKVKCWENNVEFSISPLIEKFYNYKRMEKSDLGENYYNCWNKNCHYLKNGKLSMCGIPIIYAEKNDILNLSSEMLETFEENIIDIYNPDLNGFMINKIFSNPMHSCSYCNYKQRELSIWKGYYPYLD